MIVEVLDISGPVAEVEVLQGAGITIVQSGGGGLNAIYGETPAGVINGTNTNFSTIFAYSPNMLAVFLNGLRQRRINDYTETGSNTFQLVQAPLVGDSLSVDYIKP